MDLIDRYEKPHRLHLETTKRCNLLCEHCYVSASDKFKDHDLNILKEVMFKSRSKGATRITFTGGEFLLRNDYRELISYAVCIGFRNIYFITNGVYLKKSTLEWIADIKVKETLKSAISVFFKKTKPFTIGIGISLDGLIGNELIRKHKNLKPLSYKSVLETIKLASNYGLYVTVNTTICNSTTASELYSIYEILSKINIDRWQVDQVFMSGRSLQSNIIEDKSLWIDKAKDSYYKIISDYIKIYPKKTKMKLEIVQLFRSAILENGFKIISNDDYHPCSYQFGSIIVEDGEAVRFCPSLRYERDEIFNLSEMEISKKSYLSSEGFKEFSSISIKDLPCNDCRYKYISHGGCRANSVSYSNNIYDKDPVCCAFAPFLEHRIVPLLSSSLRKQYDSALYKKGKNPDDII